MTFAPVPSLSTPKQDRFQQFIREATTAFWDAYLKEDPAGRQWFGQQLPIELGQAGKLECRSPTTAPATLPSGGSPG